MDYNYLKTLPKDILIKMLTEVEAEVKESYFKSRQEWLEENELQICEYIGCERITKNHFCRKCETGQQEGLDTFDLSRKDRTISLIPIENGLYEDIVNGFILEQRNGLMCVNAIKADNGIIRDLNEEEKTLAQDIGFFVF